MTVKVMYAKILRTLFFIGDVKMLMWITFFANSVLLGVGLAMDAFSVSLANGLAEPKMKKRKLLLVAGVFAFFQYLMPMIGWVCVHTAAQYFSAFQKFIPWIALALLGFIGGNMLIEGLKKHDDSCPRTAATFGGLCVQGIATSIDALSVGFTIADYSLGSALLSGLIIGAVTFVICAMGVLLGKKFGCRLAGKASILGGVILILIGLEIFITGII